MSVIASWTATPRRLEGALRTCASFPNGRVGRRVLGDLISPPSLRRRADAEEPASIDEIVSECVLLGGLELEGPEIVLTNDGRAALGDFRTWCRERLLHPERAERAGQKEFPRVLAWFLTVDPSTGLRLDENQAQRVAAILGDPAGLRNNDSFRQFLHWARYLGFGWWTPLGPAVTRVVPDPSDAIRDLIPQLGLPTGKLIPLGDLIRGLATICPVLEEGDVRTSVEKSLPVEARGGISHRRLSGSTALALRRLEKEGALTLSEASDASSILLGPSSLTKKRASHVVVAAQ